MHVGFVSLLLLLLCSATLDAQPLRLGSSREEVMQVVYRSGAHADTLGDGSFLIQQLRSYPNTRNKQRYSEIIRVAPVRMFDLEGYGAFAFDVNGRLVHYSWMRRDMSHYALGTDWKKFVTWNNDVEKSIYERVNDQLRQVRPPARWTGGLQDAGATPSYPTTYATHWEDSEETMRLTWYDGGLTLDHRAK